MTTANAARMEFAPPATPGLFRAILLAIFVHCLLLAGLALSVKWKRDAPPVTVEAEIWSTLPVQAAPPPQPDPFPVPPEPVVAPVAKKVAEPPPAPTPPVVDPNIAIEKEKARLEHQKQLEREQLEQQRKQREALKAQQIREEKEAREKEQREKLARDKKLQQQQLQEQQKLQAAKNDVDAKKLAELRRQQLARITQMAEQTTGNGQSSSTGTAKQSSGPSASYAGRIVARIKPNITYTESINGNPVADVEVRTSPDGTIISRRLVKSSGVKSWDDAVINAIDKTEKLPPDVDGRVIPSLTLGFRPKD